MQSKLAARVVHGVIAGVLAVAMAGHVAHAAKEPVEVPGSSWETEGTLKIKAGKFGSDQGDGTGDIIFSLEPDNEFRAGVTDGVEFEVLFDGTYVEDKPGKPILTVAEETLLDQINDDLPDGLTATELTKVKAKVKLKKGKEGPDEIKLDFQMKFVICSIDGCQNSTFSYKGTGFRAINGG